MFASSRAIPYQGDSPQTARLTVRAAMEVHLGPWFYRWHQVTRRSQRGRDVGCLARVAGERDRGGKDGSKGGGVDWAAQGHRDGLPWLSRGSMQTPAFRGVNNLPQTTQRASGELCLSIGSCVPIAATAIFNIIYSIYYRKSP